MIYEDTRARSFKNFHAHSAAAKRSIYVTYVMIMLG